MVASKQIVSAVVAAQTVDATNFESGRAAGNTRDVDMKKVCDAKTIPGKIEMYFHENTCYSWPDLVKFCEGNSCSEQHACNDTLENDYGHPGGQFRTVETCEMEGVAAAANDKKACDAQNTSGTGFVWHKNRCLPWSQFRDDCESECGTGGGKPKLDECNEALVAGGYHKKDDGPALTRSEC